MPRKGKKPAKRDGGEPPKQDKDSEGPDPQKTSDDEAAEPEQSEAQESLSRGLLVMNTAYKAAGLPFAGFSQPTPSRGENSSQDASKSDKPKATGTPSTAGTQPPIFSFGRANAQLQPLGTAGFGGNLTIPNFAGNFVPLATAGAGMMWRAGSTNSIPAALALGEGEPGGSASGQNRKPILRRTTAYDNTPQLVRAAIAEYEERYAHLQSPPTPENSEEDDDEDTHSICNTCKETCAKIKDLTLDDSIGRYKQELAQRMGQIMPRPSELLIPHPAMQPAALRQLASELDRDEKPTSVLKGYFKEAKLGRLEEEDAQKLRDFENTASGVKSAQPSTSASAGSVPKKPPREWRKQPLKSRSTVKETIPKFQAPDEVVHARRRKRIQELDDLNKIIKEQAARMTQQARELANYPTMKGEWGTPKMLPPSKSLQSCGIQNLFGQRPMQPQPPPAAPQGNFTIPAIPKHRKKLQRPQPPAGLSGKGNPFKAAGLTGRDNPFRAAGSIGNDNPFRAGGSTRKDNPFRTRGLTGKDNPFRAGGLTGKDNPFRAGGSTAKDNPFRAGELTGKENPFRAGGSTGKDNPIRAGGSTGTDNLFKNIQGAINSHRQCLDVGERIKLLLQGGMAALERQSRRFPPNENEGTMGQKAMKSNEESTGEEKPKKLTFQPQQAPEAPQQPEPELELEGAVGGAPINNAANTLAVPSAFQMIGQRGGRRRRRPRFPRVSSPEVQQNTDADDEEEVDGKDSKKDKTFDKKN